MSTSVMLPSTPSLSTGGRSTGGRKPASTAVAVASNNNFPDISKLQNLCKRDPVGHREDYDAQVRRLRSECAVLSLSPSSNPPPKLPSLVQFVAAVSSGCYRGAECDRISSLLMSLLMGRPEDVANTATVSTFGSETDTDLSPAPTSALTLHRDVRRACVSALILMRNKGAVPPLRLLGPFFRLMCSIPDATLREKMHRHVVNDIRNINANGKRDEKVNRGARALFHRVVSATVRRTDGSETVGADIDESAGIEAKRAIDVVTELYRKNVWTCEKTVAIFSSGVTSECPNVMAAAVRFFLNIEERMNEDQMRREGDIWDGVKEVDFHKHSRKTKRRIKQVERQVKNRAKQQLRREKMKELTGHEEDIGEEKSKTLFPAIELLRDPQGLAEACLRRLRRSSQSKSNSRDGNSIGGNVSFERKLLLIDFVTRLVGNHNLLVMQLYPFLRRYLGGHQRDVTRLLTYVVQSCHVDVPPDEIHGLLKTIVTNFVTERCSGEQMAVGINACRAICARTPSALSIENSQESEEGNVKEDEGSSVTMDLEAFARDLAAYSKHRDRSVTIAGKAWMNFVRVTHPVLLQGKDRGREGSALHKAGEKPLRYGERNVEMGVAGSDLLAEYESQKAEARLKKADSDDDEESESDEDEDVNMDEGDEMDAICDAAESDAGKEDVESNTDNEGGTNEDEVAPTLVPVLDENANSQEPENNDDCSSSGVDTRKRKNIDLSKMTPEERVLLRRKVSSTRIFTTAEFVKMRKLVDREDRARHNPRAAARLKRLKAKGMEFEQLSGDESNDDNHELDSSDSEDDEINVKGVVNPFEIMANSKKKRENKMERLEKIVSGRDQFEFKQRAGGSTNKEKVRKKNFQMTKFSYENRKKSGSKETARQIKQMRGGRGVDKRDNRKRRRKT